MPLQQFQKDWLLKQVNKDPSQFDVLDSGQIVPKQTAQPVAISDNGVQQPLVPAPMGAGATLVKEAIHAAPAAVGGGIGAALGTAAGIALAPATGGLSIAIPVITGIGGALLGGTATSAIQEKAEEALVPDYVAQRQANLAANPWSGVAGRLAAMPLGGMNPSLVNPVMAGGTAARMIANPLAGRRILQNVGGHEVANLANVGIGTGIGTGMAIGQQLAQGQSLGDIATSPETLEGVAGGLLFSKPNAIGQKVFGFEPTPEISQMRKFLEKRKAPVASPAVPPVEQAIANINARPQQLNPLDLLRRVSSTTEPIIKETPEGVDISRIQGEQAMFPLLSAEQAAQQTVTPRASLQSPEYLASQADLARSAHNQNIIRELNRKTEEARVAKAQAEHARAVADLQQTMAGQQLAKIPEVRPAPRVTTEMGAEIYPDYTGAVEAENMVRDVRGEEADLIQDRLERRQEETEGLTDTPEMQLARQRLQQEGLDPNLSTEQLAAFQAKARTRGVDVTANPELQAKGTTYFPSDREALQRIAVDINPDKAGVDTPMHEGAGHAFFQFLRESPFKSDRDMIARYEQLVKDSGVLEKLNAERAKQGKKPWDAEEFMASQQGVEAVLRDPHINKESEFKNWWGDFKAHMKDILGRADERDIRRIIDYKWHTDPAFEAYFGKRAGSGTGVRSGQQLEMSSDEGFNTREGDDVLSASPQEQDIEVRDALPAKLPPAPAGYRRVKVVKPDGGSYEAFFNDKYFPGTGKLFGPDMPDLASLAKVLPDGSLTHSATKPGEKIEELPSQLYRREQPEGEGMNEPWSAEAPYNHEYWSNNFGDYKQGNIDGKPWVLSNKNKGLFLKSGGKWYDKTLFAVNPDGTPATISSIIKYGKANEVEHPHVIEFLERSTRQLPNRTLEQPEGEGLDRRDYYRRYDAQKKQELEAIRKQAMQQDTTLSRRNVGYAQATPEGERMPLGFISDTRKAILNKKIENAVANIVTRIGAKGSNLTHIKGEDLADIKAAVMADISTKGLDTDRSNPLTSTIYRRTYAEINKLIAQKKLEPKTSLNQKTASDKELSEIVAQVEDTGSDAVTAEEAIQIWESRLAKAPEQMKPLIEAELDRLSELHPEEFVDVEAVESKLIEQLKKSGTKREQPEDEGLTPRERQINSPEFKRWFGDSKVVDKEGKPLVVYHGTGDTVTTFEQGHATPYKWSEVDTAYSKKGFFFTPDPLLADYYSIQDKGKSPNIMPVYLQLKNPLKVTAHLSPEMIDFARKAGHDGLYNELFNEYVVFEPEQIKSATGNQGTFDPSNPDIRMQPEDEGLSTYESTGPVGKAILSKIAPEVEKLRSISEPAAEGATKFYELNRAYKGQLEQSLIREVRKAAQLKLKDIRSYESLMDYIYQDNKNTRAVVQYFDALMDGETPTALTTEQQNIAKAVKANLKQSLDLRESFPDLDDIEGLARGTKGNPNYLPHVMSRVAAKELADNPTGAKAAQLFDDFVEYRTTKRGQSVEEATQDWNDLRSMFTLQEGGDIASKFGAIDKAAGLGLPKSMREQNLLDRMSRFNRRFARRVAYHEAIQRNEEARKAFFDKKTGVASTETGKSVLEDIFGIREHTEATRQALSGVVRAAMLGPLTGAKDVVSGQVLGLQHMDLGQVLPAKLDSLKNWSDNYERAWTSGILRENIGGLETGEGGLKQIHNVLGRSRDIINTVQGRNLLENVSRVLNFGEGRYLALDALMNWRKGKLSKQQEKFLENFMPDYEQHKEGEVDSAVLDEAAAKYVESVQGTYDYRGLPAIAMKGTLSPYLSLARWNVEKFNNFTKHVVDPAMNGDFKPLLMSTIGMFVGGAAVNELVEQVTGRKQRTATWNEVANSPEQMELLSYKLAALASLSGYAGVLGDATKTYFDWRNKNRVQTWNNPLVDAMSTAWEDLGFLHEALQDGNMIDITDALHMVAQDYIQAYRVMLPHFSEEKQQELEMSNKRRDLKVFKSGFGYPVSPASTERPNPLVGQGARDFKRTEDVAEAARMLPDLWQEAIEDSKDANGNIQPEVLKNKLSALKRNSYQTVPSPTETPMQTGQYLNWLSATQGKQTAEQRMIDYVRRNAINKAKSSLVPSL